MRAKPRGFTVALFYCFLNTEVQNTVRHHFETWKTRRSLGPSRLRSGSREQGLVTEIQNGEYTVGRRT
ncbi:hypothetical protein NQ317_013915 [Molorchus minor]|uniref:Secreted protein n=1 Tax=Molorchus minor TaxID=1323400 RepID=A0ABQ9K925_9CUCU|nr:hypothetical protein NQ317_013915 [Molorchus minor]